MPPASNTHQNADEPDDEEGKRNPEEDLNRETQTDEDGHQDRRTKRVEAPLPPIRPTVLMHCFPIARRDKLPCCGNDLRFLPPRLGFSGLVFASFGPVRWQLGGRLAAN